MCFILIQKRVLLIGMAFLATACATPKTAEEFRQATRSGTPLTTAESIEVERSFKDVTATLRKKTNECLAVRVDRTCVNCVVGGDSSDFYRPTFVAKPERTEVHLQLQRGNVIEVGAPPTGNYRIVLDAVPLSKHRTRIDVYSTSWDDKFIWKAMQGWARGDNLGCPDLTRR